MNITETVKSLTRMPGISGFENEFAQQVCDRLKEYCIDARITKTNCVIGMIESKKEGAPTIMLEAHLDRIGLIVSSIDENGFVGFRTLGGVDERILPAAEVEILGEEKIFGVIGAKPPHLMKKNEEDEGLKIEDMLIDTGLGSEAVSKISVGDPVLLVSNFSELMNNRVSSAALDNRLGMAVIFDCLDKIKDREIPYNLCIVFASGEEQGLLGAYTVATETECDFAVVVDVTYGETPDAKGCETFPLGCGVTICRGPNVDFEKTKRIIEIAKEKGIPYEIEVASGSTGTNAWALQTLGRGIPCAVISVPIRYMHTAVETADICDAENAARLIAEIVSGGEILA
ncbi:MAG: M42 family peptidase [Clostridia bacterium]|nr:M42 family peptidase [Clostridia bacterium]